MGRRDFVAILHLEENLSSFMCDVSLSEDKSSSQIRNAVYFLNMVWPCESLQDCFVNSKLICQ